ncbi:MAG: hypothetical protein E6850_09250 [Leclercia adecarboxylata]|nr:hypothetical protein [Leclercia adecarboxylata]
MSREQVMDFYNNDSSRPFEMSFWQNGKTVGTMRFNGDVMTFEGEADSAATVFIDMIIKKQSQQWVDVQEKISTSEFALNEFFHKTNWVQDDSRFDVIIPWGKHRADVLREYIDHVEAKCAALAAEKEKFAVECAASKIAIAYLKSGRQDFSLNTPTTDAFLAEVRATSLEDFADVMAEAGNYDAANYATNHAHKIRQEAAQ